MHWSFAEQAPPAVTCGLQDPAPTPSQKKPLAQLASPAGFAAPHPVRHVAELAQTRLPGQGAATPALQVPVPLQYAMGVNVEPEHAAAPHVAAVDTCSHAPPAAQLPSLPQGGAAAHCPAGAGVPGL